MKNRKPILAILTLLPLMLLLRTPAAPTTVAVFDFTCNFNPIMAKDITALINADLSADPRVTLVERAQLGKALSEQALGLSGEVDFGAAAKVGEVTGAKILISGRAMKLKNDFVIIANIIGTETSRVQIEKVQGSANNLLDLTSNLCEKIALTIVSQSSNFVGTVALSRQKLMDDLALQTKGKHLPTLSIAVTERVSNERGPHRTAQYELATLLQKAGFEILNDKADRRPDILIVGSAVADTGERVGNLFSARASLELQAQDRKSGKLILIDHEQCSVSDIARRTAARLALEKAADSLAQKFVPALVAAAQ